jgi:N-acetylglucosaminyl-diphospho-decaprenol L-rhamnosyltransferase
MPTRPRLAVVTVLYRSAKMLADTGPTWVGSARNQPVEFVFVDNGPGDECASLIAECFAGVPHRYLAEPGNPGFAAACNRAVQLVRADHVLLLNPDVWLAGDSLAKVLCAVDEAPGAPVAVGLAMRGRDYAGIDPHPVSLFIDREAAAQRGPLGPSGGAGVYPVELLRRFGGFHEDLFAWGEDADLAYRLYAAGVRTRVLDLRLRHAWGHSIAGDPELGQRRAFLLARNRLLVAARSLSWPLLAAATPVLVLGHGALALRRAREGTLRSFLAGLGAGLRAAPAARRGWRGRRFGLRCLVGYRTGRKRGGELAGS